MSKSSRLGWVLIHPVDGRDVAFYKINALALTGAGLTPPASGESHTWGFLLPWSEHDGA